jgi:thiamine pyridinylase
MRIAKQWIIILALSIVGAGVLFHPLRAAPPKRQLKAALYPFIPEFASAADTIKQTFEAQNPDVELVLLDLSSNYYDPTYEPYIENVQADVIELDSVFLADFIDKRKIQELPAEFLLPQDALLSNAYRGSVWYGKRYGAAHWVCRNFLFYDKSVGPPSIQNLSDLEAYIGPPSKGRLLIDLRGKLTVSELYLMASYGRFKGDWSQVAPTVKYLNADLEKDLTRVLGLCPTGSCRDQIFHEVTGIYGQQFGRKYAKAVVGYSELLHSVLLERAACGKDCLGDADLGVSELPFDDAGASPISWVDSLTVAKGCTGQCLADAGKFLTLMSSDEMYLKLLLPTGYTYLTNPNPGDPVPAYLLPAKASLYSNPKLTASAHLYPELKKLVENAAVPTAIGLNADLQKIGKAVNTDLGR